MYSIKSAQKYLILHLKRWIYDDSLKLMKVKDKVPLNLLLNLKKFLDVNNEVGDDDDDDGEKESIDDKDNNVLHKLHSVVSHEGELVGNGHYVTYMPEGEKESSLKWTLFNDPVIQTCCTQPNLKESYILVYEKKII